MSRNWAQGQHRLGHWLGEQDALWRFSPFDEAGLEQIKARLSPKLSGILTGLREDEVLGMLAAEDEGRALRVHLAPGLPALAEIQQTLDEMIPGLRRAATEPATLHMMHARRGIGGRKLEQIDAFLDAVGPLRMPALDWCAGKGHLGRLAALRDDVAVDCLERDPALCRSGAQLARRDAVTLRFIAADALSPVAEPQLAGRHVLALHACGELHRRLVDHADRLGVRALDVAPCCHHRGNDLSDLAADAATPFAPAPSQLRLSVTGYATASASQRQRHRRLLGWQCALRRVSRQCWGLLSDSLPSQQAGAAEACRFSDWAAPAARKHGMSLPAAPELAAHEAAGHAEALDMLRASLLRLACQRPIETWLVARLAARLEGQGYAVTVRRFCAASLTPRNLLVSARH